LAIFSFQREKSKADGGFLAPFDPLCIGAAQGAVLRQGIGVARVLAIEQPPEL